MCYKNNNIFYQAIQSHTTREFHCTTDVCTNWEYIFSLILLGMFLRVLGHLIVWFVTSRHRHQQISRQKRDSFVELKNEWASQKVKFKRWNFTENICLINLLNFYQRCLLFALRKQKSAQLSPNTLTQCEKFLSFNKKIN